ncbi:PREDICTED: uncharacterized protein LOC108772335 [Cyphomyrmex costatus]|uniref:uncharacterized protein LOC108772335 n=1 Tax=Cyphomyrmex costatus TaxID=456900 RepID=UPI00085240F7|nr:PREDICTED: uncharacterized protein LOC108772335 [Cyphomyrmex costatus]
MNSDNSLSIKFKINTNDLELTFQDGEDLYEKLLNDDSYAIQYVKLIIQNGLYVITDGGKENLLKEIYRLETLIYNININKNQNLQNIQYTDKEDESDLTSAIFEENNSPKHADSWTDFSTVFMLDKYKLYLSQIGPMKKFKSKKTMWAQISKDLQKDCNVSKTSLQVENRYKTVLKRKKKAVENNHKSGNSREKVPFEEELREISQADDSIEPEVLRSAQSVKYLKEAFSRKLSGEDSNTTDESKNVKYSLPKKRCKFSNEERKLELFKQKEEAKERKHQEKLQLLKELFGKKESH